MPKIKCEIEIELSEEDAAKYEPTGEYREPKAGECYVGSFGVQTSIDDKLTCYPIFRLKPEAYKFPEGCTAWGWAMDKNGKVFLYEKEALRNSIEWIRGGGEFIHAQTYKATTGLPVPTITDWTKPVLNPNYKPSSAD